MRFKLACGDVMPGCAAEFVSGDRDQMMAEAAEHARAEHGIVDLTPEIVQDIDQKIITFP